MALSVCNVLPCVVMRDAAIGEAPYRVLGQIRMLAYVTVFRIQASSADLN